MAVLMGVVSLILFIYSEEAADIGSNLPRVFITFGVFLVFAAISGLSSWSLQRRHRLMWPCQGLLGIGIAALVTYFTNLNFL